MSKRLASSSDNRCQRVDQPGTVLNGAGAAALVGVAGFGGALADMMRRINRAVVLVRDLRQHVGDHVHLVVRVLDRAVRLDQRVDDDDVDVQPLDRLYQPFSHPTQPELVIGAFEELAAGTPRRGVEQPPLKVRFRDPVMLHCRRHAAAQLVDVVFQADKEHTAADEHILARENAVRSHGECLCNPHRGFAGAAAGLTCTSDIASIVAAFHILAQSFLNNAFDE